jgi:hypothetical protein
MGENSRFLALTLTVGIIVLLFAISMGNMPIKGLPPPVHPQIAVR